MNTYFDFDLHFAYRPIMEALRPLNGRRILDFGCGQGKLCNLFSRQGADTTGIDHNETRIRYAQNYHQGTFLMGDHHNLPSARYDAIVSTYVFCQMPGAKMQRTMKNLINHLQTGGHFIIADPHPTWVNTNGSLYTRSTSEPPKSDNQILARTSDGKNTYQDYWHSTQDYRDAIARAGLELITINEPVATIQNEYMDEHNTPPTIIFYARI